MRNIISILFILLFHLGQAQKSASFLDDDFNELLFYSDVMVNADSDINRRKATIEFNRLFEKHLHSEYAFNIPFESIPYIKCQIPPDSTFKLITYSFTDNRGITENFGTILMKNGNNFSLSPILEYEDMEYEPLYDGEFISSIYYFMKEQEIEGKKYYILFGFSQPNFYEKQKVIEVLSFENGKPVFGKEIFVVKREGIRDEKKMRRIYRYAADVAFTLQYDKEFNALVIDHLMEVKTRIPGAPVNSFVPDGTYTSYHLQNDGTWSYRDKLFLREDVQPFSKEEEREQSNSGLFPKSKNN